MKKLISLFACLIFLSSAYAANSTYKWTAEVSPSGKATIKYGSSNSCVSTYSSQQTGNGLLTRYFNYTNIDSGYEFDHWELWESGSSSAKATSTNVPCSFQFSNNTNDKTVKLILKEKPKYTISATSGENGSATVNGESSVTVYKGTNVTLVASPNPGYELDYWSDNNSIKDLSRTVSATSTRTYTAYFKQSVTQYTINVGLATGCTGMGTVKTDNNTTSKTVNSGSDVTITATSNDNVFKGWSTSDTGSPIVSTDASYEANVTSNITYYAVFEAPKAGSISPTGSNTATNYRTIPTGYVDLSLPSGTLWAVKNIGAETADGTGSLYAWGSKTARTNSSYNQFTYANYDATALTTTYTGNSTYDIATSTNASDHTPTQAEWDELIDNCHWDWDANRGLYGGYVISNDAGQSLFLIACGMGDGSQSNQKYCCYYWSSTYNTGSGETKEPYYLCAYGHGDAPKEIRYASMNTGYGYAHHGMAIRPVRAGVAAYTLTIQVKVGNNVVATNTYRCDNGEKVQITASTPEGYEFVNWKDNNNSVIGTNALQTFTVTGNATYTANFEQNTPEEYTITYMDKNNAPFSGTHESGYPTTHTYGTATTLKTASKTGYLFDGWYTTLDCSGSAVTILGANDYDDDITLYANWTQPKLTIDSYSHGTVSIATTGDPEEVPTTGGEYVYAAGTTVNVYAEPASGYRFKEWYNESTVTTAERQITLNANMTITPVFEEAPSITIDDTWTEGQWKNTETNDINAKRGQQLDATLARSFSTGAWATLSLPFAYNMTSDDALYNSVYKFRRVILSQDGGSVYIDFIRSNDINANEPYLVVPREDVTNPVFNNVTLVAAANMAAVTLSGTGVEFISSPWQQTITGNRYFYVGANSNLYYAKNAGTTIKGNRAYFHKKDGALAPRRVRIMLDGVETEKEIAEDGSLEDVQNVRKYMENGRLVIECNGVRMDATGKKIN